MLRALPDLAPVLLCAFFVALVAFGFGAVDAIDSERQLANLRTTVCDARLPRALVARADHLFASEARAGAAPRDLVARLSAAIGGEATLELYYEAESALWSVTRWSGPRRDGALAWPQEVGRWEEVAWATGCREARRGAALRVARTVPTRSGHFVVLVATRWRSRE